MPPSAIPVKPENAHTGGAKEDNGLQVRHSVLPPERLKSRPDRILA